MRALVMGGGIVGVTTAYQLCRTATRSSWWSAGQARRWRRAGATPA